MKEEKDYFKCEICGSRMVRLTGGHYDYDSFHSFQCPEGPGGFICNNDKIIKTDRNIETPLFLSLMYCIVVVCIIVSMIIYQPL